MLRVPRAFVFAFVFVRLAESFAGNEINLLKREDVKCRTWYFMNLQTELFCIHLFSENKHTEVFNYISNTKPLLTWSITVAAFLEMLHDELTFDTVSEVISMQSTCLAFVSDLWRKLNSYEGSLLEHVCSMTVFIDFHEVRHVWVAANFIY